MTLKHALHILSAEDQRLYADLVSAHFEEAGHTVTTVENGELALDANACVRFDLLVTDHSMPRMNGLELVSRLKERGFLGKVIVHSSRLTEENINSYRGLGVELIVMKGPDTSLLPTYAGQLFSATEPAD